MHLPFDDATTAALCGVSESTARAWRSGRRSPGPASARLLALYSDGQAIPAGNAWHGFAFDGDYLVCPNGYRLRAGQIACYRLVFDMLRNFEKDVQAMREELARQDAYIARLEGERAPANSARRNMAIQPGLDAVNP